MRRSGVVQKGQRYAQDCQIGYRKKVWEVASLGLDSMQVRHARIFNVGNPSETKTLSCFALTGQYGFSLVRS